MKRKPSTTALTALDKYRQLTPGARAALRGSSACRPQHADWPNHNLAAISDLIASNPYIRAELGPNLDVSIQRSKDGLTFAFFVSAGGDK